MSNKMNPALKLTLIFTLGPVLAWLLMVALLSGYVAFFLDDIEPIDDSDLRLEATAVPDEENVLVAYLSVTNLCTVVNRCEADLCADYRQVRLSKGKDNYWTRKHPDVNALCTQVDQVLSNNAAFFRGFHAAAQRPAYKSVDMYLPSDEKFGILIPKMHWHLKLVLLKALREIDQGELTQALETLRDGYEFCRKWRQGSESVLDLYCSMGFECMMLNSLAQLSCVENVPTEVLCEIAALAKGPFDHQAWIERYWRISYGEIGVYAGCKPADFEGLVRSRLGASEGEWKFVKVFMFPLFLDRFAFKFEDLKREYADSIRRERTGSAPTLEEYVSFLRPNWMGLSLARATTSVNSTCVGTITERQVTRALARLTVAAQRYRRAHGGSYPETLEALVPEYLEAVPEDPYAPGCPLNYDAKSLAVWSVGSEGSFNAVPATPPHDQKSFKKDLSKYACRLDGDNF